MERMVNLQILFLLGILLALSLGCAIGSTVRNHVYGNDMWYLLLGASDAEGSPVSATAFVKDVLTFILTLNNLIPISYVALFRVFSRRD
jgi:phospholipid-transporting ATPase